MTKKTIKKPKISDKKLQDIKEKLRKEEIDHKKLVLDKLVSTLAEYGLPDLHWMALGFKELAHGKLKHLMDLITDDKDASITKIMFGIAKNTDELHKANLAYYDSLIKTAEHKITELSTETKKKIIMDGLTNRKQWDFYWDECSKLLAKKEKPKPKSKKK